VPEFYPSHTPSPNQYTQPSSDEMTWGERIGRRFDQLVVASMVAGSLSVWAAIADEVHDRTPVINCEEAKHTERSSVQELIPRARQELILRARDCVTPEDRFLWKGVEFVGVPAEKAASILRNGLDNIVIRLMPEINELPDTNIGEYMCADNQAPAGALCSENQPLTPTLSQVG